MKVLIVDDETAFVEALSIGLRREGFSIVPATNGTEALAVFERESPDLLLLDVMLPDISGIEVCRRIRRLSDVPIIMVSARADEVDTVVGLEVGADDYVAKPYRLRELIARINAVLRRRAGQEDDPVLTVGDLIVDVTAREVRLKGEPITLPRKEFELLQLLAANAGRVLTRDSIIDRIWGFQYEGAHKTLDVHIRRLRSRIEDNPAEPARISTVRGVGYRMERR